MTTSQQNKQRRLRHLLVDALDIVGGGLFADSIARRSVLMFAMSLVVIGVALWLDRRNAMEE